MVTLAFPAPDPELRAVGERLRTAREARGWRLEALATAMRIAPDKLRRGEAGRERLSGAELYAAILELHLPVDLLFRPAAGRGRERGSA